MHQTRDQSLGGPRPSRSDPTASSAATSARVLTESTTGVVRDHRPKTPDRLLFAASP